MYRANSDRYEAMEYRRCGKSGLKLPIISLGMWHNFGDGSDYDNMKNICFTAFDNGINHFDLANNYGPEPGSAERNVGRILKEEFGGYRDELIISTKAGYEMWPGPYGDGGSRKYLLASLDQSLRRMGLEYVDIFYHHRMDKDTPLEETMLALSHVVKTGKALYVGLSNYDGKTLKKAMKLLDEYNCPFTIGQNSYNIFNRTIEENGILDVAEEKGKGIIAFSPLAQGLLTEKYMNGIPKDSRVVTDGRFLSAKSITKEYQNCISGLALIAKSRGETLSQMALNWILKKDPITSVLVGVSSAQQVIDNLKASNGNPFSCEELAEIDALSKAAKLS